MAKLYQRVSGVHAAVDAERVAGDISRLIGSEKANRMGNIAGLADSAEGYPAGNCRPGFFGQGLRHRRLDETRRDRIHRDVSRPEFLR